MLVNSADSKRQSPASNAQLPYDFLEQFHVFVLANILQRPIIIVGEPYLRSMTGDSIEPNDFVGIYLPLMWPSMLCPQTPIVLAFLMDHFLPLSCRYHNLSKSASRMYAVPLVTSAMEPLRVHFLLSGEENSAHLLLQQYLELVEVQSSGDSGCDVVLAAKVLPDEYSVRQPMTVRHMFQCHDLIPKCRTENCEFPNLGTSSRQCIVCSMGYPPYQSLVGDTLRGCFDGATLSRCATVGCFNQSWLPYGGMCRLCSIGCYPHHYDMPFSAFVSERTQRLTNYGVYVSLML